MHCCLWLRSVFRVRGPWPKRYGYHLNIIVIVMFYCLFSKLRFLKTIILTNFNVRLETRTVFFLTRIIDNTDLFTNFKKEHNIFLHSVYINYIVIIVSKKLFY